MKFRILTTVFALLLLLGLTGCTSARVSEQIDRAEDAVENQLDKAEDAVETMLETPVPAAASPEVPATTGAASASLTKEEAEQIALEHAGFTADQVNYLRTEYEIDDGRPQYEVEFHQGRWEYDYEIDAETGKILSFDKDD